MTMSTLDPPVLSTPETRKEANDTLSKIQSAETSYNSICNQALQFIETYLSNPELDSAVKERLRVLLPKISQQKDKVLALISQAQNTLDADDDNDNDDDTMDPTIIAEYEQTVNDFTMMTRELNQQLELLANVVTPA